ncbi:helix-turn-helix domain-containing protein [[Clostridium] innocuum]|nr:helix-turn-helix domain-containing protein [[Clostridium] innocuum]MCR0437847.1 helix-turn-helix domain-containing protein [[Clostridium] innocuum]
MSQLDEEFYKYIGMKIKEARHLKKYSLEYIGRHVGKTKKTIQRYEENEIRIDCDILLKICSLLNLNYQTLLNHARIYSLNIESLNENDKIRLTEHILEYIDSLAKKI